MHIEKTKKQREVRWLSESKVKTMFYHKKIVFVLLENGKMYYIPLEEEKETNQKAKFSFLTETQIDADSFEERKPVSIYKVYQISLEDTFKMYTNHLEFE